MAGRKSTRTAVVIEGSVTPAFGVLRRGRQAAVTRTDHIDDLERRGFIVFRHDLTEPEAVEPDPVVETVEPDPVVETVEPDPVVETVDPDPVVETVEESDGDDAA